MNQKFLAVATIAVVTALTLSSCSGTSTPGGTTSSKSLHIYAWAGEVPSTVVKAFKKKTGITVTVDSFESNESMISKLQAGNSGYDIVEPSQYAVQQMVDQDLLANIDKSKLTGFDNLAQKFQNPTFDPGNAHSIPWLWGTTGILYNSKCTGAPVTSWADLWNPKYKGKVYMLDNQLSAYIAGLQVLGFSANSTKQSEIEAATKKLIAQKPVLAGYNSTNYADLVASGDACIAEAYSGSTSAKAVASNADVHYVLPSEGGSIYTDSFAIVKGTANTSAAYQWLNFTLQPEVAAMLTDDASLATTNQAALKLIKNKDILDSPAVYTPQDQLTKSEFLVNPGNALTYFNAGWTQVRAS